MIIVSDVCIREGKHSYRSLIVNIKGCVYHHPSGVELRFPNDFQSDFGDDKRKVFIRGLRLSETPKKSAIWNVFEPETRFCRDDKS